MGSRKSIGRGAVAVFVLAGALLASGFGVSADEGASVVLPSCCGGWTPPAGAHTGQAPSEKGSIEIRGLGTFAYDPGQIQAQREGLFRPGQFSVFDVLVALAKAGTIPMEYTYDESMGTYVILSLNGKSGWWYDAHYAGGAFERPVVRMDEYPVKDGMAIQLYLESPERLAAIYKDYADQVARFKTNAGRVIIPKVRVRAPQGTLTFDDVLVTAHNVRADVFQTGVITVLDVLLSLGEEGKLQSLTLSWRDRMESEGVVGNYYVDQIQTDGFSTVMSESTTYMHEVASTSLVGFLTSHEHMSSHVHLASDAEVLTSPEYVEFQWSSL